MKVNIKKNHIYALISITIIIILIFYFNSQKKEILSLKNQITKNEDKIFQLNNQNNQLYKDLVDKNSTLLELSINYADLEENFLSLDKDYSNLKEETSSLITSVEEYQKEIQESLEWYKTNSLLDNSKEQNAVKRQIDNNCYDFDGGDCYIKLGCFYLINSEKLDLEYSYDEYNYNKEDKLSSISQFLQNKGGDCEDYSLFFKAEYNYVKDKCKDKNIILEGWKYSEEKDRTTNYWLNFQKSWYLEDVTKVEFTGYIFPNIICGNFYDSIVGEISGHCMIAFSNKEIKDISDLEYLDGSYIIEPQDGSFQGNLNRENSNVYLLNKHVVWYDNYIYSYVYSVINDNDYFLFNEEKLDWDSYSAFNHKLMVKKNQLKQLI